MLVDPNLNGEIPASITVFILSSTKPWIVPLRVLDTITIGMQSPSGYSSYNWFYNNTTL